MRSRFAGSRTFESAEMHNEGNLHLRVELSSEYYPSEVSARFEIRWYRNDDFNFHYQEERLDSTWKYRWDRHPNAHNSRDHFHPPPAASRTDAENAQWPTDHREMSRLVLDIIEERIETLWEQY
ncbi:hypothetical protein [Salinigranum marinum]|uniref:hypothetical protein n=1 Tax=Salinigranum marinum TaxID=1515595 RepID=UPI003CCDFEC6